MELDAIVARLKDTPPWIINTINELTDTIEPCYSISSNVVDDLIITEPNLDQQVSIISAQIQDWGRLEALARRVVMVSERKYRHWRSCKILGYITPNQADRAWKKPTEAVIEAMYRSDPGYVVHQMVIERNEEAFNATHMVLEGFKAKLEMLKIAARRSYDLGMARQSM